MKNLKRIRKEQGLSQLELAKKCNLSKMTISHYETNTANPPLDKIELIADALNIKVAELFNNENSNKEKNKHENIDIRVLKKILNIQKLPLKEQNKIWEYAKTVINNYKFQNKKDTV